MNFIKKTPKKIKINGVDLFLKSLLKVGIFYEFSEAYSKNRNQDIMTLKEIKKEMLENAKHYEYISTTIIRGLESFNLPTNIHPFNWWNIQSDKMKRQVREDMSIIIKYNTCGVKPLDFLEKFLERNCLLKTYLYEFDCYHKLPGDINVTKWKDFVYNFLTEDELWGKFIQTGFANNTISFLWHRSTDGTLFWNEKCENFKKELIKLLFD